MASGAAAAAGQRYISWLWKEAAVGMGLGLVSTHGGALFFLPWNECHHPSVSF